MVAEPKGADVKTISPDIDDLVRKIIEFREARDWRKFHTLKNLASALAVEVAELLEITQWKDDGELETDLQLGKLTDRLVDEIADVLIYLLLICDKVGVDPIAAAHKKLALNESRYPAEEVRGSAAKFSNTRREGK